MNNFTAAIEEKWSSLATNSKIQEMLEEYPNITKEVLHDIAEYLVYRDNEGYITDTHILDLYQDDTLLGEIAQKAGYPLYNEDGTYFISPNKGIATKYLYIYMVYIYKFGSEDSFWTNNIRKFIPRYDNAIVEERDKLKLLFDAIGIEFDKLEQIISKMADLQDIDKVPNEYLQYLAQLLGYEKEDFRLGDTSFREIVKNIIEIYKIKGTNYSFKFFFKFLGFDYNVSELFFDRDRNNPGEGDNKASNYLTDVDPRKRFEVNPNTGEVILYPIKPNEFTETRNLELFDILADNAGRHIPVDILLGKTGSFPEPFTYFKTNMIKHELSQYFQGDEELVPHDPDIVNKIINKYIKFLTPSYIQSSININMTPYTEGPIPVYESFGIELIKQIFDIVGLNTTQSEWENLKTEYETMETDQDVKEIEVYDEAVLEVELNTDGVPLSNDTDRIGSYILHNGVHVRGPNLPSYIQGLTHQLTFKTALESVMINVKHPNWDYFLDATEFTEYLRTHQYPTEVYVDYTASNGEYIFELPYVYDNNIVTVYINNILTTDYTIQNANIILNNPLSDGDSIRLVSRRA